MRLSTNANPASPTPEPSPVRPLFIHRYQGNAMRSFWLRRIAVLLLCCPVLVLAQSFPNKPIKVLVPFPAGGTVDFFARTLAPKLSEALGQTVLVENRPGAGGNIATEAVAKAAPDGYTLLMGSEIVAINTSLYSKLNYDPLKDLAPIVLVGPKTPKPRYFDIGK